MSRNLLKIARNCRYRCRNFCDNSQPNRLADIDDKSRFAIKTLNKSIEIEKVSLSRGLAMNRFEKDFMIYPEYTDSDEVEIIEGFVNVLRNSLELTVDPKEIEKEGNLPSEVVGALKSNGIFGLAIDKSYGGVGMNNKNIAKVFEELSIEWNVFTTAQISHSIANILTLYGSEDQKQKYLTNLANGKYRPAIATYKNIGLNSAKITHGTSGKSMLSGDNIQVVGHHNPNLYVIFGTNYNKVNQQVETTCYIIDETELNAGDEIKFTRDSHLGLKATDIGKVNVNVMVKSENVVGVSGNGAEIGNELIGSNRMPFAAATVGMARRALRDLSSWCNTTPSRTSDRTSLASESRAQKIVTDLALKVYALESALYYISGMIDEGLSIVIDIENSLMGVLSRDVIQQLIAVQLELVGCASSDASLPHEKIYRDITTLLSMIDDGVDVESIALATISTWATSKSHKRIVSTLKRLLGNERDAEDLKNPELTHYIAEHAHPSLQKACQDLENSMTRINIVISKLLGSQGKNIEQDYGSLEAIVKVLKNNLMMISTITRASRSYSIGLRNSDIELAWATMISSRLSRDTWFELDALSDIFGLVKYNPSILIAGKAVFDLGGYPIESALEKNW